MGDGDTIRVRNGAGQFVTIRLACIDAPATALGASGAASTQTVDCYGGTAAEVLVGTLNGKARWSGAARRTSSAST